MTSKLQCCGQNPSHHTCPLASTVLCLSCSTTPCHLTHQRRKRILFPAKEAQSQSRSAESTRKIDSSSHETQAARGPLCLPARQLPFAPRPSGQRGTVARAGWPCASLLLTTACAIESRHHRHEEGVLGALTSLNRSAESLATSLVYMPACHANSAQLPAINIISPIERSTVIVI